MNTRDIRLHIDRYCLKLRDGVGIMTLKFKEKHKLGSIQIPIAPYRVWHATQGNRPRPMEDGDRVLDGTSMSDHRLQVMMLSLEHTVSSKGLGNSTDYTAAARCQNNLAWNLRETVNSVLRIH